MSTMSSAYAFPFVTFCRHIDNVKGSDINQNDMGHDTDGILG